MRLFLRALLAFAATTAFGAEQSATPEDAPKAPDVEMPVPVEASPASTPSVTGTEAPAATPATPAPPPEFPNVQPPLKRTSPGPIQIYVIRVHEDIGAPALYIVRNGVKEANAVGADYVVVHIDTYGGELGATLDIMEALKKCKARTVTFVDDKAMSAGSFISAATQDIYLSPSATIGAAAPVDGSGKDIDKTMKEKIVSFLSARIRVISEGHGYRGEVVTAMMDADFEFKIGDVVIKEKGRLLTLTAPEAMKTYGDPPVPLLGAGIFADLPALEQHLANGHSFEVREFKITWSINVFRWFNAISSILIGLGILGIYLEFQMGGHGWFAGLGIALLLLVFIGNNTAGLSGHEPMLVFVLGIALIVVDVVFFPGTFIAGGLGVFLALASLVWAMMDIWPNEPIDFTGGQLVGPLANVLGGLVLATLLLIVLARFLPETWLWKRMTVQATVGGTAQMAGAAPQIGMQLDTLIGHQGVAVTALRPSGQIRIGSQHFEATTDFGAIDAGDMVVVRGRKNFGLLVERVNS